MSEIKKISITNFKTDSGAFYDSIDLFYQNFGQNYKTAPVVLVNHSLTGDSNVCGVDGWWSEIVGPGLVIDTDHYSVLAFNIPGNGVKGSIIDKCVDFHTGDIAAIFHRALCQLSIKNVYAIIGGSIGGSIVWEMGSKFIIPIILIRNIF